MEICAVYKITEAYFYIPKVLYIVLWINSKLKLFYMVKIFSLLLMLFYLPYANVAFQINDNYDVSIVTNL